MKLASLGTFIFELSTLAYQELQRRTDFRHGRTSRFGAISANQYLGPGEDTITLAGLLVPQIAGDPASIETLRDMAATGESHSLVDGSGNVIGDYVLEAIDERQDAFFEEGVPRRTDFAIDLIRVERVEDSNDR